ncbi:4803_t:CDS:2, partial [Acaulospora colombiana]
MPNLDGVSLQPLVIGSIGELGNWKSPTVKLHQNDIDSTYWVSDSVKIRVREEQVFYKYALYQPKKTGRISEFNDWFFGDSTIIMEGDTEHDNRTLLYQGYHYDIWKSNNSKKLYSTNLYKDFKFVDVIYESANPENLKEKIMEFQSLSKSHPDLTARAIDTISIMTLISSSREGYQRIFISFLLGHHIDVAQKKDGSLSRLKLTDRFPSAILLRALREIKPNIIPSNAISLFSLATSALVRHNSSKRGEFDWMKMFAIAPILDPSYTFLPNIEKHEYSKINESKRFYELLKRDVKPYIDKIDKDSTYQTVVETIIKISFFNIESCDFIMNHIIEKEEMNEKVKECINRSINNFIGPDNPCTLEQHFKSLSEDLRIAYFEIERILKQLSTSKNHNLLLLFPEWSKLALDNKPNLDRKIPSLCEEWYCHTISNAPTTQKGKMNIVSFFYKQLSAISFAIEKRPNIHKRLASIIEKKIASLPNDWFLQSTSFVGALEPYIIREFKKVLIKILDPLLSNATDESLIKIISLICDISGPKLYIPNQLCEEILLYILDSVRENSVKSGVLNIDNKDDDTSQLLLIKSSKLWIFLLNASGEVYELLRHQHVKYVCSKITKLVRAIENKSIRIGMLSALFESPNEILIEYFAAGIGDEGSSGNIITKELLESFNERLREHTCIVEQLYSFYHKWCGGAADTQSYLDDLNEKMNALKDLEFAEIVAPGYWSIHREIIEVSQKVHPYKDSKTFFNVFMNSMNEEVQIDVSSVAKAFRDSLLENYQKTCLSYKNWGNIKCSEAWPLWKGITREEVRSEFELMNSDTTWYKQHQKKKDLIKSIESLALIPSSISQLRNLSNVIVQFNVKNVENSWANRMLNTLKNDDMTLGQLPKFFKDLDNHVEKYKEIWPIIKELSSAKEFIGFLLKDLIGKDLTNLINAVDDQSDTKLLQENTVAALIEVNKALNPLNKEARASIESFLDCLTEISKKNPSLPTNINSCSSHNLALQNMYRNVAKRGEVTKERIKNAATIGTYTFQHEERTNLCEVLLTYDTTQIDDDNDITPRVKASYNLADLHDLYGRALLIGKSRASTDRINDENNSEDIDTQMNQFIIQVDLVQRIIDVASKLIRLGHFLYQMMHLQARGVNKLQKMLDKLTRDLKTWEEIVNRAQNEHYYLTFFSARQILTFYDYFRKRDESLKETCNNFIRFVNDTAQLPQTQTGIWDAVRKEEDFLPVLRKIGITLRGIFSDIPLRTRTIPEELEPIVADTIFKGHLFVAACNSRFLVPNVILSLFANHRTFPEPWQLLICRNTTTAEEISLFIKRSFIAASNGYEGRLFCIADVELLDFELQYNLVQAIRDFQEKENDYLLALICTREKGTNHHILDQFAENVHVTNGLDAKSMKMLYEEICPDVVCVTSNMSGQGKTEWIKESSFRKGKVPRTLLISDNAYFKTLVRQLADCNLGPAESLHLDITLITNSHEVNFFLFELLTLGIVSNDSDIVHLPKTLIYIEIASTIKQHLLDMLPLTKYLHQQEIEWNMKNLIVPFHVNSPLQVVSYYLDKYARGVLDDENIRFTGDNAISEPLSPERCRQLLEQYFFNDHMDNVHSYRFLEIFVNVLADQLVRFSASSFFQIEQLRIMTKDTNIRSSLLEILISCSKEFATRAIKTKDMQKKNIQAVQNDDTQEIDNARLGDIAQWDDSNHLVVVFLSQMPDSICALYREKNKVPKNVENLLKSQNAELQDYSSMGPTILLERLEQLARRKMNKLTNLPEYALSIENMLKMAMILLRSRANIPVVCCGEAGCGKTSLIRYLSMIMEVNFSALNLHAGIHENDIINFMEEVKGLAQKGETWVFFDEINTCDHIGMLGSLISHRLLNGKLIHPNIRIFAACNPYRLRTKAQSSVGLSAKLYEEKNDLVYR